MSEFDIKGLRKEIGLTQKELAEKMGIAPSVWASLSDYSNTFLTSTVCVHELIHLYQIGKLGIKMKGKSAAITDFSQWLVEMGVAVVPVSIHHLQELASLPLSNDHRDPNDRLIIAQAISDRIPLISSDRKFAQYARYGLDFIFNER